MYHQRHVFLFECWAADSIRRRIEMQRTCRIHRFTLSALIATPLQCTCAQTAVLSCNILANDRREIAVFTKLHDDVDRRCFSVNNAILHTVMSVRTSSVFPLQSSYSVDERKQL